MSHKLVILTGAGISAESGIKTFRDSGGLWEGHKVEDVCNGFTWKRNFQAVHRFYNERRTQLATVAPNAAHYAIAEWQRSYETVVLTQNVDDLLERAGCRDVVHLHGVLTQMRCCACDNVWDIGYAAWDHENGRCPRERCRSRRAVRPNIVFFHEGAPRYRDMYRVIGEIGSNDTLLVMGTSGVVLPINTFAKGVKGRKIINNLKPEPNVDAALFDHVFYGTATEAVGSITAVLSTP